MVDASEGTLSDDGLLAFLHDQLVVYKLPGTVEFVDEPLRDDAVKVRRRALRESRA